MTGLRHHQLVAVCFLTALCQVSRPCKVSNWRRKSVGEQASEADIIVFGTIRAHYPLPNHPDVPIENAYVAEMNVTCNLKGEVLPARVNISEAGELTSCHHTRLPVGGTFITFLARDSSGRLVPDEVNYLSVAFPPTGDNVRGVGRAVDDLEEKCPELEDLNNAASGNSGSLACLAAMAIATLMY